MDRFLACKCGEVLVKSMGGEIKIRGKILIFRKGAGFAVCKSCGKELEMPFKISDNFEELYKSPRLFLVKDRK